MRISETGPRNLFEQALQVIPNLTQVQELLVSPTRVLGYSVGLALNIQVKIMFLQRHGVHPGAC